MIQVLKILSVHFYTPEAWWVAGEIHSSAWEHILKPKDYPKIQKCTV